MSFTDPIEQLMQAQDRAGLIALCHKRDAGLVSEFHTPETLPAAVETHSDKNTWLSCARFTTAPATGRGKECDVNALAMLPNDFDYKPGGFTESSALTFANTICERLGIAPFGIVATGHGIQLQIITDPQDELWECDNAQDPRWSDMRALVRRFGRYLTHVASTEHGAKLDNVYDLSRILRAPAGINWKDPNAPKVVEWEAFGAWSPVGFIELSEALDALGVNELDTDRNVVSGEVLAPASTWEWAPATCRYSHSMITNWATDTPTGARHHWLTGQGVRLAAAHRRGCLTESDYTRGTQVLVIRFRELLKTASLGGVRPEAMGEIVGALQWGHDRVEHMTQIELTSELGNHLHATERESASDLGALVAESFTDPVAGESEPVDPFEREVRFEAHRLRVIEAAKSRVRAENVPPSPPFDAELLENVSTEDDVRWRIEGLLPMDGNATIIAQRKTGKTTLMLNMARSLVTGEDFLGRFPVAPVDGVVALLNFEVSAHQAARWAIDVGVPGERLLLVTLRGRRNPFGDPAHLARLAELLRSHRVDVLMVDPFGRAYNGKSQQDPGEVGAWLVALDMFAAEAGATSTVLSVHAGWNGERTRGASSLEDWPDSLIYLTRDDDSGERFLRADGRDVDVDEDRLNFDPNTRALSMTGAGSRKVARDDTRRAGISSAVLNAVSASPGLSVDELTEALRANGVGLQRGDVSAAANGLAKQGKIERRKVGRNVRHFLTSPDESRHAPAGLMNESRPVPIGRDSLGDTSGAIGPASPTAPNHQSAVALAQHQLGATVIELPNRNQPIEGK